MLRVIPLGGLGEIGLNAMAIEAGQRRMLVDCGLMFPRADAPGVDIVVPDFTWLHQTAEALDGVVLTHAHEDHIGALPYLLREVPVPVWGTRFTLALVRRRLEEAGLSADLRLLECGEPFKVGDTFTVEAVRVTHSVPDAVALIVRSPFGTLVHTGDFKLDGMPIDGHLTDLERLGAVGEEGIDLLLSDSTNAEVDEATPSERLVADTFERVVGAAKGRVVVALFGSHLHRVNHLVQLAARHGRRVAVLGRSLERNVGLALDTGLFTAPPGTIVSLEDAGKLGAGEVLLLCTGAQAEPRAALSALLNPNASDPKLPGIGPTDTVVLSSRTIPGNEIAVSRLVDRLLARGARVLHPRNTPGIHVSGHAARPELKRMLEATRPRVFVPVHGELKHLKAHLALAGETLQDKTHGVLLTDGDVLGVAAGHAHALGRVPVGQQYRRRDCDGVVLPEVIDARRSLAEGGLVVATIALATDPPRIVWGPRLEGVGLSSDEQAFLPLAEAGAKDSLLEVSTRLWGDDARVREELVRGVRRVFRQLAGRKPAVVATLVRL